MKLSWAALPVLSLVLVSLIAWRQLDRGNDLRAEEALIALSGTGSETFVRSMTEDLPEPAQRYFTYTISEGASLKTVVRITMTGELGLGTKDDPKYGKMQAEQILAPPYGLVWKLRTGFIIGSDGITLERSWTRFWLGGILPIVRASGPDHHRSAFGRVIAESAFWSPAFLLLSDDVEWEALDENAVRAIVSYGGYTQNVDITIDAEGKPLRVSINRWSNTNPSKTYKSQPFGGELSDFRNVDGYMLPFHVEGGNLIGTEDYFPFYKADVQMIEFLRSGE